MAVTQLSEIDDSHVIQVGRDKSFYHVDVDLSVRYNAYLDQVQFTDNPMSSRTQRTYWLFGAERGKYVENVLGRYEFVSGSYRRVYIFEEELYRYENWYIPTGQLSHWTQTELKWIDDTHAKLINTDKNGGHSESTTSVTSRSSYWGVVPSWSSRTIQRTVSSLTHALLSFAKTELPTYVEREARWQAALKAADGVMAYDLNMVEAVLNFGIDDIIPKKVSTKSLGLLENLCHSKNPIVWMARLSQISATMYLNYKYVISTNVDDLCQITGLDPDIASNLLNAAKSFKKDDVEPEEINQQLYTVARKISFAERYLSSTYGNYTTRLDIPIGTVTCKTNARLLAYPGEYADLSALGIITDEFGLKLTASRGVEAIPWEFVANWFIPIEKLVHSIEFNDAHLNVLFNVQSLCESDLVTLELGNSIESLDGLAYAQVKGRVRYYNRTVSQTFPTTQLSFKSDHGGISMSRILQGGSLIITR
jgi:hypothetical protein